MNSQKESGQTGFEARSEMDTYYVENVVTPAENAIQSKKRGNRRIE